MDNIFLIIGLIFLADFIISTILIYNYVAKRTEKPASFVLINLFIFSYVNKYREITKKETGRTGILFYIWIAAINITLICIVLHLLLK